VRRLAQEIQLKVELMGALDTKTSRQGDRVFRAVLQPDGLKGDTVEGAVKDVHSGGKLHGSSVLNFSLKPCSMAGNRCRSTQKSRASELQRASRRR